MKFIIEQHFKHDVHVIRHCAGHYLMVDADGVTQFRITKLKGTWYLAGGGQLRDFPTMKQARDLGLLLMAAYVVPKKSRLREHSIKKG